MHILFGENLRNDKPRRIRIKMWQDKDGTQTYLLQAKYFLFWQDNYQTTRSPRRLLWAVKGLGMRLDDVKFFLVGNVKPPMDVFKRIQHELDYFPHKPPAPLPESAALQ